MIGIVTIGFVVLMVVTVFVTPEVSAAIDDSSVDTISSEFILY